MDLIAATSTKAGLKVRAQIDANLYPPGVKVSDQEIAALHIERDAFHGEWNYIISPRSLVKCICYFVTGPKDGNDGVFAPEKIGTSMGQAESRSRPSG